MLADHQEPSENVGCTSPLSRVRLFATPWTVAHQTVLSMGFSRQEYWSGLLCPPPRDLPNPGIEPKSPVSQADSLPTEPIGKRPEKVSDSSLNPVTAPSDSQDFGLQRVVLCLY